ncbi:DUF6153 family protein [Arthrobacter sp. BF1]|uniref:DUF6153 family protein n=1 Tax=Arthrobacter sp. BF1 TaxID=2821145 RepID=UPI001C4F28FA|nr:DUF6153 family protein [Arthrobacter sp. BF1]
MRIQMLSMGPSLRWGSLVVVVLAIIGGIFGMHVINSMPAGSMTPGGMVSAATSPQVTIQPNDPHTGLTEDMTVGGTTALDTTGHELLCGCSPAACPASMDMHQGCVPMFGSAVVSVPLPGTLTYLAPGAAFLAASSYTPAHRSPDPPSLTQLSISRT